MLLCKRDISRRDICYWEGGRGQGQKGTVCVTAAGSKGDSVCDSCQVKR